MDFASALERSALARSKVAAMERALASSPMDKGLRITMLSAKRMADRAEAELLEIASAMQVDLCRYRVVKAGSEEYPVAPFAKSVVAYQELFTALYDFVKNGPRSTARYTPAIQQSSCLNVGYTYPGSLGVVFTIPSTRDLFDEGELDSVIGRLADVTAIKSMVDVQTLRREMGLNVVRKTYAWALKNREAEYSLDIQWRGSSERVKGEFVTRKTFVEIADLINQTEDKEPETIEVVGTLGSYSVLSDTFAIVTRDGQTFSGKLHSDFQRHEYSIPREYRAKMIAITVVKYATESAETVYHLTSLEEL